MDFDQTHRKKRLRSKEATLKAIHFCTYQERSKQQVRDRLCDYGLYMEEVEEVLLGLINDGFLNEERFARVYVGGKFRMKKWGRNKILQGLEQHKVSEHHIKIGFKEIDDEVYRRTLEDLMMKKTLAIKFFNDRNRRNKLLRYAIGRGYETPLVWEIINKKKL